MNIPTPTEIEAVLDPLLLKIFTVFKDNHCVLSRQLWRGNEMEWRATTASGSYTATGSTPAEAVVNLIAQWPVQLAKRRAKLQAEIDALEPDTVRNGSFEHDDRGDN